jgi:hypothetical protein
MPGILMELKFEREKGNKDLNIFAQEALRQISDKVHAEPFRYWFDNAGW